MQLLKPYLTQLGSFFLLISVVSLQSCADKSGVWKNDKIKSGKKEDFHALNSQVFNLLKANDVKRLGSYLSKELIENHYTTRSVELISNSLADYKYDLLDEYYVVNKFRDNDTIIAARAGKNGYDLYYQGITREMYFSFFLPKTGDNKYMITVAYARYDYGWKISQLDLAPYTINGKTAPELFEMAKQQYAKNYLIDAVNDMSLATSCLRPCDMWQYPAETEITEFYTKIMTEANEKYKFPFTLTGVPTKPRIIKIYLKTDPGGSFPVVYYFSSIKLADTTGIKRENENIRKVIGNVMPGIDKNNKYIYYSAFNMKPDGKKTMDHFDMTEKLR